jgi:hypothetical protein
MQTTTAIGLSTSPNQFSRLHRVDGQVLREARTDMPSRARSTDFWGLTSGLSVVLPYVFAEVNSSSFERPPD